MNASGELSGADVRFTNFERPHWSIHCVSEGSVKTGRTGRVINTRPGAFDPTAFPGEARRRR